MNSSGTKFFNISNINKNTISNNFNNVNTNLSSSLNFNSINYNNTNTDQLAFNLHPTREIKSSYSTFRPKYDYSNLMIEKNNLAAKQKELAEKRHQEEVKEMLNEWGNSRARYTEEVEKKHETQTLLKFYQKNLSNLNSIKNLNTDLGNMNSLLNKNLSNLSSPMKELVNNKNSFDSPAKEINNNNNIDYEIANQVFLQSPEKNKNKNIIDINEKQIFKEEISLMRLDSNEKTEIDKGGAEAKHSKNKSEIIICKNPPAKARNLIRNRATKIKNLDPKSNKVTFNKDQQTIDIKFKEDAGSERTKKIIKQMKSTLEKIPTDKVILMKAHDKVFEARHNYGTLLNVKEIDNYKDGYKYHVTPLSLYDNLNVDNFKDKKFNANQGNKEDVESGKRPSTGFEFLRSRYNKNPDTENLLIQRKNLTNFNLENAYKVSDKPTRNISLNLERVKSAFNPPVDDKVYPKYFLPTPGFGLVVKVLDPNAKKKKRRGKSSKKKK